MMLRKLMSVMIFALPITCWAWGPAFYVGGGLGADTTDYYDNAYVKQSPNQQKFSVINDTYNAAQGIFGTLFGGYSIARQGLYLAGEVNGNISTASFKTTNSEFDHSAAGSSYARYQMTPTWGVSLIPGWLLLEETALIYARIGYAGGVFQINTTDTSLANVSDILSGIRYGVGIEKRIYNNLGVRLEYSHITYQSDTVNVIDNSNTAITPKQSVFTPQANQFEFSLLYRFN